MNEKKPQISPEVLERISKMVQEKTGTDPDKIKQAAKDGSIDKLMGKLNPAQSEKLMALLSDKQSAEALLATPQARQLIKKLFDQK